MPALFRVVPMELRDALTQIAEIRQKVAQAEQFRGYKALPVAFSGVLAPWRRRAARHWLLPSPNQHRRLSHPLGRGRAAEHVGHRLRNGLVRAPFRVACSNGTRPTWP